MSSVSKPQSKALPVLTAELRTTLTPVLGYLDLILDDLAFDPGIDVVAEQHLHWVGSVERQLHNLRDLSGELIELCEHWRGEQPEGQRNDGTGLAPSLERRLE